jgi:acetyl esterase/lipase
MNLWALAASVCALLAASGCVHLKPGAEAVERSPLPPDLASDIQYQQRSIASTEKAIASEKGFHVTRARLTLPLLTPGDGATNRVAELDCYVPDSPRPLPVVLLFPISGGGYFLETYFAEALYREGFAAIIVRREHHPDFKSGEEINAAIREGVLGYRRVIDWVCSQPEFDPGRIGVLGTSMGAIKAALLTGVDPRVRAAVLGLVGGNLPYILAHSTEGSSRGGGITKMRENYMEEHKITREQFYEGLKKTITWDPDRVAPAVAPGRVLLILGTCDTVVPTETGKELRRKLGKPETIYIVSGHYTALFYLPYIRSQAVKFLKKHLSTTDKHG